MCGIAGAINYQNLNLDAMKESLQRRGPNEQAIFTYQNVALVHTRLSIQDVEHAHQPMHLGDISIIFNGEIYNHKELRDLHLKDFSFRTNSDTETLLALYVKYGFKCLSSLDGMFAFCIFDRSKNELFFARDRAGKKPLYYGVFDGSFIFASELNAIKAGFKLSHKLDVDEQNVSDFLRLGFFFGESTVYKNIKNFPASSFMSVKIDTLQIKIEPYFDIERLYSIDKSVMGLEEAIKQTDELLTKSVRDRLLSSDLEVGAFLSGGIDSSLITAIASQIRGGFKTFTVKFKGAYDESPLARLTAEKYGTTHTEIEIEADVKNDIEKILNNYGQPFFDSSAIPSWYVSREAKKHLTVILNGDGADELFGGYRRYVPFVNGLFGLLKPFGFLSHFLPHPSERGAYSHIYRLLELTTKKDAISFYMSLTNDLGGGGVLRGASGAINSYINEILHLPTTKLSQIMLLDFKLLLFSDLLVKMDIATMANSLEGRSPFLSKHILEFAPRLPDELKIKGKTTKYLLRELAKKYLPQELIDQPKRGFEVPLRDWVDGELKENIYDLLTKNCYTENYIDRGFIDGVLSKKYKIPAQKRAKILWSMYCLEVWKRNN